MALGVQVHPIHMRASPRTGVAGMGAGVADFVVVNVGALEGKYQAGEEVTLENLKEKGLVRATGRRGKLPLKVS